MEIKKATAGQLPAILELYGNAREFMREHGNPNQWYDFYPEKELLEEDIREGRLYVMEDEQGIHGAFAFFQWEDPTYAVIEDGAWLSDAPYGTIHRIAGDGVTKGILRAAVAFCSAFNPHLRIDTHHDNKVMQGAILKNGFQECGVIYVEDGSPRIAYELLP